MAPANKVKNTLLFLTQTLDDLKFNAKYLLEESFKHTNENLYIYINPLLNRPNNHEQPILAQSITDRFKFKLIVNNLYQKSFRMNPNINVTCLLNNVHAPVAFKKANLRYDKILTDLVISSPESSNYSTLLKFCDVNIPNEKISLDSKLPVFPIACQSSENNEQNTSSNDDSLYIYDHIYGNKVYQNTIMGGTFDRLHIGHKIMLSEAVLLTKNRLLIGVTAESMLTRKKLSEMIESFDVRCANIKSFLNVVATDLEVLPVIISDPFGPSIVEKDYQCLVVSRETFKTGELVNSKRIENSLPELEIHVVELIKDTEVDKGDEEKVSSSNERRHLLGTLLKQPYIPYNPSKPYVIGLTGGIASGKSTIRKDLENLGAATIDCDKLGHLTYEKDTEAYKKIVLQFGPDILDENDSIDRKKLGAKVFDNRSELKNLTDIVWPEIQILVDKQIELLAKEGKKLIVVEAALLIDANWNSNMNEIWVCFVPDEEAIERSMRRDNSNLDKVQGILNSQMKNKERIKYANVVLSSLWEREYTIKQVHKAWDLLLQRTTNSKL